MTTDGPRAHISWQSRVDFARHEGRAAGFRDGATWAGVLSSAFWFLFIIYLVIAKG